MVAEDDDDNVAADASMSISSRSKPTYSGKASDWETFAIAAESYFFRRKWSNPILRNLPTNAAKIEVAPKYHVHVPSADNQPFGEAMDAARIIALIRIGRIQPDDALLMPMDALNVTWKQLSSIMAQLLIEATPVVPTHIITDQAFID